MPLLLYQLQLISLNISHWQITLTASSFLLLPLYSFSLFLHSPTSTQVSKWRLVFFNSASLARCFCEVTIVFMYSQVHTITEYTKTTLFTVRAVGMNSYFTGEIFMLPYSRSILDFSIFLHDWMVIAWKLFFFLQTDLHLCRFILGYVYYFFLSFIQILVYGN